MGLNNEVAFSFSLNEEFWSAYMGFIKNQWIQTHSTFPPRDLIKRISSSEYKCNFELLFKRDRSPFKLVEINGTGDRCEYMIVALEAPFTDRCIIQDLTSSGFEISLSQINKIETLLKKDNISRISLRCSKNTDRETWVEAGYSFRIELKDKNTYLERIL